MLKYIACIVAAVVIVITGYLYVNYTEDGVIDIYNDSGTITLESGVIIDPVDGSVLYNGE